MTISPDNIEVNAGDQVQFSADAPVDAWSASVGVITSGGLWTAPNRTTTAIITATSGSQTATATARVLGRFDLPPRWGYRVRRVKPLQVAETPAGVRHYVLQGGARQVIEARGEATRAELAALRDFFGALGPATAFAFTEPATGDALRVVAQERFQYAARAPHLWECSVVLETVGEVERPSAPEVEIDGDWLEITWRYRGVEWCAVEIRADGGAWRRGAFRPTRSARLPLPHPAGDYEVRIVTRSGARSAATPVTTTSAPARVERVGVRDAAANTWRPQGRSPFGYGAASDVIVWGDWTGHGLTLPGVFRDGRWFLRLTLDGGDADLVVHYGAPGDVPVVGDWDGDGVDGIGVYRDGEWLLRNSLTSGVAEMSFSYGGAGDAPVVGDWNGNGTDTVGVYRGDEWFLRNSNSAGTPDIEFAYGAVGDTPLVGDWDGDGVDTIGVFRSGQFFLRNSNSAGLPDVTVTLGSAGDQVFAGYWE